MRCCKQAFNEAGIAFEPFHLKQEREEGYFDADGNYIQYKLDEVKDAWLDSLAEGDSLACLPSHWWLCITLTILAAASFVMAIAIVMWIINQGHVWLFALRDVPDKP